MIKRFCAYALTIALCLGLAGCSYVPYASEAAPEIVLPEPSAEPTNMILGERVAAQSENVTLYYVSGDGNSFSTITRSMTAQPGESIYAETVDTLLYSASSPDRMSVMPSGMQLLDVEYACGIVTVNLSLDAHGVESEQEYLMLLTTVTNTLLSMDGVRGVNMLVNGRSLSVSSLPVGAQTTLYTGITSAYAQLNAENDYFLDSETGTITRTAVLYFPTSVGEWLVPELREITFDSSNYAASLIRALRMGPLENRSAMTAIPESVDLLVNNPVTEVSSAGERVLRLEFSSTLRNYLAFSGLEEWQMIGSVTLTACSFVPEIDAVQIYIGDERVEGCVIGENEYAFEGGLIRRSDFDSLIGSTIELCIPNGNGTLDAVERAVSMERAQSPQSLLYALFDDVLSWDGSASSFPAGVYYNDILGISVENGIASVNLSANFYRQSQALDATAERGVVYAIVNTLCGLEDIAGVRFYIEGIAAETLSGSIYLKGVLLPNPGLVSSEPQASPEITASP